MPCTSMPRISIAWQLAAGLCLAGWVLPASPVQAADTVTLGFLSSGSASEWPLYIGQSQGFFSADNIDVDIIHAQANAAVIQQLTAGSTNMATSAGLVDPIRAIEKGAPLAIVRIAIQAPPYSLLAKSSIKSMTELKGKTIIIGGPKDITRIFTEEMLKAKGVNPGEYDLVFAGATNARFSALQSGAVDAALLTTPFNFFAESAGFTNLGFTADYLPDMPFAGVAANRTWAAANPKLVERFLGVMTKSIAWFNDEKNRDAAVGMMVNISKLKKEDVEKAYTYMRDKHLFEPTGKVSRSRLGKVVAALRDLGDVPADFTVERLVLPGVTQMSD